MTFTFTFTSKFEVGNIVTTEIDKKTPRTIIEVKLDSQYQFRYLLDGGNKIYVSESFLTLVKTETA